MGQVARCTGDKERIIPGYGDCSFTLKVIQMIKKAAARHADSLSDEEEKLTNGSHMNRTLHSSLDVKGKKLALIANHFPILNQIKIESDSTENGVMPCSGGNIDQVSIVALPALSTK